MRQIERGRGRCRERERERGEGTAATVAFGLTRLGRARVPPKVDGLVPGKLGINLRVTLSSELGTYQTVQAIFWPWLSGGKSLKPLRLFPLHWAAACHGGQSPWTELGRPYTELHPTPYTRHPAPDTLNPTSYTLHPTPYTLHPTLSRGRPLPRCNRTSGRRRTWCLGRSARSRRTWWWVGGLECRVRVQGVGCRVQGVGCRV